MKWPWNKRRSASTPPQDDVEARVRQAAESRDSSGRPYKLLDDHQAPLRFGNVFEVIHRDTHSSVWAGADEAQIETLIELVQNLEPPYGIVWVLTVPRGGSKEGRYATMPEFSLDEVSVFLRAYCDSFECDGRHAIWVGDTDGRFVVYDQHNWLHCYGPVDRHEQALRRLGFTEGTPELTVPHSHLFHDEFDEAERIMTAAFEWHLSELQPGDDE